MAPIKQQLLGLLLALLLAEALATPVSGSPPARARRQLPSSFLFGAERPEGAATTDSCERVRRGAMLCMLCRDAKSSAKYEQCSYAPGAPLPQQPTRGPRQPAGAPQPRQQSSTYRYPGSSVRPGGGGSSQEDEASAYSGSAEAERAEEARPRGCRTVRSDDGESCTVCTDPATGAQSERCDYAFRPRDKAYAYSKSKSFGYPRESGEESRGDEQDSEQERSPEGLSSSAESRSSSAEDSSSHVPDYARSESERVSERLRASGQDCRQEIRDSMVCRVCKDPRSGDDVEQCSYSYEPDDKHYAYSKSTSFGNHRPDSYEPQESRPRGSLREAKRAAKSEDRSSRVDGGFQDASRRRAEIEKIVAGMKSAKRSDCSKSYRDGMTCYSCKDREGLSDEECVFVSDDQAPAASRPRRQTSSGHDEAGPESSGDYDRPVYDKALGLRLPAYMLERSAAERHFDRSSKH